MNRPTIQNQNEALGIILRALDIAQSKGAFTLNDAAVISDARSFFIKDDQSGLKTIDEEIDPQEKSNKKSKDSPKKKST